MLTLAYVPRQNRFQNLSRQQKRDFQFLYNQLQAKLDDNCKGGKKGLEGMNAAHQFLKENSTRGILIGGLSKEIRNRNAKEDDLRKHKDVDVLVLDASFQPLPFEGGIDWWLPQGPKSITYYCDNSSAAQVTEQAVWWQNGNGITLRFGIRHFNSQPVEKLSPGLYIPSPDWVARMLIGERTARYSDYASEEVLEALAARLSREIGRALPAFVRKAFDGHILEDRHYKKLPFFPSAHLQPEGFPMDKLGRISEGKFDG